MPSVHCAWALWCTCALVPRVKHTWAKVLAVLYPVGTVTAIVLTANHYFLDAVGGFIVLGDRLPARPPVHPGRAADPPTSRARRRHRSTPAEPAPVEPRSLVHLDHVALATRDVREPLDAARRRPRRHGASTGGNCGRVPADAGVASATPTAA